MADLKPELANRSKYWISKHRYYELKHFCLQYPEWLRLWNELEIAMKAHKLDALPGTDVSDPTAKLAMKRAEVQRAINMVRLSAYEASRELASYILKAVTEGIPFNRLQTMYDMPCGKDMYYDAYRKFFWFLSQRKGI